MKRFLFLFSASLTFLLAGCLSKKLSSNPSEWTQGQVSKWFDSKEWLGTSALRPDPSINKKEFAIRYHQHKDWWNKAFQFLSTENLSALTIGDHDLVGKDVFIRVSEYTSKNPEDAFYESHREYTDLHEVITGAEYISTTPDQGTIKTPYNQERDITFFTGGAGKNFLAAPGTFFIYFPGELHRPGLKVNENRPVKKIVIKIKN